MRNLQLQEQLDFYLSQYNAYVKLVSQVFQIMSNKILALEQQTAITSWNGKVLNEKSTPLIDPSMGIMRAESQVEQYSETDGDLLFDKGISRDKTPQQIELESNLVTESKFPTNRISIGSFDSDDIDKSIVNPS